jgi:hypothetical protein
VLGCFLNSKTQSQAQCWLTSAGIPSTKQIYMHREYTDSSPLDCRSMYIGIISMITSPLAMRCCRSFSIFFSCGDGTSRLRTK